MSTVKPVEPIRPVRGIRAIGLRRIPPSGSCGCGLFARQKANEGGQAAARLAQAATASPERQADRESAAVADHGHIDKRA